MSQPSANEPSDWTIGRLLEWTRGHFDQRGLAEPRLCAEVLLAFALDIKRIDLYARFEVVPDDQGRSRFREMVRRAADHEPVAYIVGRKEFFSLSFEVTADVLIPRPETELLVECVLDICRTDERDRHILDVATGSGCIPIAILKHLPDAKATATDISRAALDVAERNVQEHGLSDRLVLLKADRLSLPQDAIPEGGFDILTCNPPYVSSGDVAGLERCVRDHEPRLALTDDADGLSFYRCIADDGPRLLAAGGCVVVEVGAGQASLVLSIFESSGGFQHVATLRDRVEGHDRVLRFVKER